MAKKVNAAGPGVYKGKAFRDVFLAENKAVLGSTGFRNELERIFNPCQMASFVDRTGYKHATMMENSTFYVKDTDLIIKYREETVRFSKHVRDGKESIQILFHDDDVRYVRPAKGASKSECYYGLMDIVVSEIIRHRKITKLRKESEHALDHMSGRGYVVFVERLRTGSFEVEEKIL